MILWIPETLRPMEQHVWLCNPAEFAVRQPQDVSETAADTPLRSTWRVRNV